jgi:hypothetical protein
MSKSITVMRLRQQQQQIRAIAPDRCSPPVAAYKGRDPVTGDRQLETGDGSIVLAGWIARSTPVQIPPLVAPSGIVGMSGYAGQR